MLFAKANTSQTNFLFNNQDMKDLMMDCKTSDFSVYFEGGFDTGFHKHYNGVIVNARGHGGYGHFAIRKPVTFWFKLPRFIKMMFPYKWVMLKNDREKMHSLSFNDTNRSITIFGDMKNHSFRCLIFDKNTYKDLKEHIPEFLEMVGYSFNTVLEEGGFTLEFKYRHYEILNGKCVVPTGVKEITEEMYYGFINLEELVLPEGLTSIGDKAFFGCTKLETVTIPSSMNNIGHDAFAYCPIRDIYLHCVNPDQVQLNDAMGEWPSYDQITLHVPAGTEDAYRCHPSFKKFKKVVV